LVRLWTDGSKTAAEAQLVFYFAYDKQEIKRKGQKVIIKVQF
jgi:hypothetical protein